MPDAAPTQPPSDPSLTIENTPEENAEQCLDSDSADPDVEGDDEGDSIISASATAPIVQRSDRSLFELNRWFTHGRLHVEPEWQRKYVWDKKRASRLIESVLIGMPIPVVYLAEMEDGNFEVVDGRQRLTSIFDYFANKYPLRGLEMCPDLNGRYFREVDKRTQSKLENYTLRTFELSSSTPKDIMFLLFERLNTGGVALNDMEIRNCLYRGPLNNLLKELSQNEEFKRTFNLRNMDRRMMDRSCVLRFLAFYERTHLKARSGLKQFLNEFFRTHREADSTKLDELRKTFTRTMKACHSIFGEYGFRLRKDARGEWAPRPNLAIFQSVAVPMTDYDLGQLTRAADRILEDYLDLIATDTTWVDAVTKSTSDYQKIEYAFDTWKNRLRETLNDVTSNDSKRCFSRELKKELFDQHRTCAICGQEIKLINDAALDHEIHYWRGGKAIPDNARLVHRICNMERGGRL